ncbi:BMP family ABC transporter substrate-binding protein [Brachybacterium sp. JHP9]|uniref:BMP family ABC transporter substrate-binding protein n=1 Tax=Brachybacterium equifaecis TaxID=2910770 RepID=A0ABT0R302_9MICO|nr:BMP family ABC transporter substrate-binding protein [Brachybacterium equifaecis]MCL6424266.1 BMP family ABC transporter substrate-binding protein [Brachybacterium equifaecis]
MKTLTRSLAFVGVSALALTACGSAPETAGSGGSDGGAAAGSDFKACMVSDEGGFNDKSFNESGYTGLKAAEKNLGITTQTAESTDPSQFISNIDRLVDQDCNLIYTVGFMLAPATGSQAQANPDVEFAIVDSTAQDADGNAIEVDNVKPISFDTAQAAFLAGYVAAGTTTTGKVATYGGIQIPTVTIFMDGFADGVAKYNEVHGTSVEVLGWDKAAQQGSFTGDFSDQAKGKALSDTFYSQGADIVMPVAGPVGSGTLASAKEAEGRYVIWVDSDGYESVSDADAKPLILTSVMKGIGAAVEDVATDATSDKFSNEPYVGTLENGGVGIAPYHDLESKVPAELQTEVEQLQKDIIDGTITVESAASPHNLS